MSEAVVRRVLAALSARKAEGALCAWIMLVALSERVEKKRTLPDCVAPFKMGVGA